MPNRQHIFRIRVHSCPVNLNFPQRFLLPFVTRVVDCTDSSSVGLYYFGRMTITKEFHHVSIQMPLCIFQVLLGHVLRSSHFVGRFHNGLDKICSRSVRFGRIDLVSDRRLYFPTGTFGNLLQDKLGLENEILESNC
jgi:hypothetical protein